ncbi:MAG: ABC transporter permease, partial [Deltaproteobacteria bacterium]|nr:ABC transporter permease [Deltaproteobacteria bacterium]
MSGFKNILRLSLRDYSYERLLSVCAILGLAAILAPLLVLFGVKNGIINTMADRLIEDPRNREVSPVGSGRYGLDWLAEMGARQDVAFIIPQTRSIAASMALYRPDEATPSVVNVDLIPTAEGDPLLEKWAQIPSADTSIVLP